ncbi:MAG TPA: PHP domain-containing protein, partial [Roseateles sp.]|nr:PHP domain-containing protein [Roseateles sp.]
MIPEYAELHCLSNFSFLRGASNPEELVERAHRLGYAGIAITDECSLAGVVRAYTQLKRLRTAAEEQGLEITLPRLLIGAEFLVRDDLTGEPDFKLVAIARHLEGYGNLCQFITQLRRESATKGRYRLRRAQLQPGRLDGCQLILLPRRAADDAALLAPALWLLRHYPGQAWIGIELLREIGDELWLQRLRELSETTALPLVACGDVHMHLRSRKPLQDVMTATRLGKRVRDCGMDLQPNAERHL